ncbi:hypothetical protein EYF80_050642 [Liparis tanakae]|uniref:Uncharacterized protein n=1 Tax=Liparis tanakae TaxID=230148 RepID=A0A4Z2FDB6_9TELE|nr:hypothetical protein EYF80_050642 [Liparis tanakae]
MCGQKLSRGPQCRAAARQRYGEASGGSSWRGAGEQPVIVRHNFGHLAAPPGDPQRSGGGEVSGERLRGTDDGTDDSS